MSEPSYEELKAQLERIREQSAAQKPPVIPDQDDPEPSVLDASPYRECIESLQEYVRDLPDSHSILCPVCGKPTVEREKSALELWEAFLDAGPGEEKDWGRRKLGTILKLSNYVLIMLATIAILGVAWYAISLVFWLLFRTFLWWLSALAALIVFVFIHDWWKRTRAK